MAEEVELERLRRNSATNSSSVADIVKSSSLEEEEGILRGGAKISQSKRSSPLNVWRGRRPLLKYSSCLPTELAKMRWPELLLAIALTAGILVYILMRVSPRLSYDGCFAAKPTKDCAVFSYRVKKFGQHIGGICHTLTGILLLPMSRRSIVVKVSGLSFDKLVKWHRWIGRAVFILSCVHGFGFYYNWVDANTFNEKFFKPRNFEGSVALIFLCFLHFASFNSVRRANYHSFWVIHASAAPMYMLSLYFHHEGNEFLSKAMIPALIFLYDKISRFLAVRNRGACQITSMNMIGNDIVRVSISSNTQQKPCFSPIELAQPCSWVYVNIPAISSSEIHPFSPCPFQAPCHEKSMEDEKDGDLVLYVKAASIPSGNCSQPRHTWTQKLIGLCASGPTMYTSVKVYLEGPHGGLELPMALQDYDKAILIAGGIGVTALLPLFAQAADGSSSCAVTSFVWCVRDIELLREFGPILQACCESKKLTASIFLTDTLLADSSANEIRSVLGPRVRLSMGKRPSFPNVIAQEVEVLSSSKMSPLVAVLTCGPVEMIRDVFVATAKQERELNFIAHCHEEIFHF